jgi:hypothetical protein
MNFCASTGPTVPLCHSWHSATGCRRRRLAVSRLLFAMVSRLFPRLAWFGTDIAEKKGADFNKTF